MKKRNLKRAAYYAVLSAMFLFGEIKTFETKEEYYNSIYEDLDDVRISTSTLDKSTKVDLIINSNNSYSFLNNCKNIEELTLHINCNVEEWNDIKKSLEEIDFKKFDKLTYVRITLSPTISSSLCVDKENFGFLHDAPNVNQLYIETDWLDDKFLEDFDGLETLILKSYKYNIKIDYNKLYNLKKFYLLNEPYSAAIFITNDDLEYFNKKGIDFKLIEETEEENSFVSRTSDLEKLRDVNNKLDEIIGNLDVSVNDYYSERLNKISMYILDELHYDNMISYYLKQLDTTYDSEMDSKRKELTKTFYRDGYLYGALYNDGSAICGNYMALFQALANRVGIESYCLVSSNHGWNLVDVYDNDNFYYYDLTFIDGKENLSNVTPVTIIKIENGEKIESTQELTNDSFDYKDYIEPCVPSSDINNNYFVLNFPDNITQYSDFVSIQDNYKSNFATRYNSKIRLANKNEVLRYFVNDNKEIVIYDFKTEFFAKNKYLLLSLTSLLLQLEFLHKLSNEEDTKGVKNVNKKILKK